ncbi:hypothetical protein Esi_0246_0014 [Ectocarpus siliculosus]|uniref:EF-hand domain-containing protein n=1 Tax=Ectocarpus siliculosus TaxID=2880 RepID=D7FT76_ECTSI|nr:hypothetical protein Esi_0246_0014 [Ectocarpus siliculosus]|eukprot:CBJ31342.1 hypothetical protein Esi_0246_0014 [Ectocarpus siliculosus]
MAQDEPRVAQDREEKGAAERNPMTTAISTTAGVAAVPTSDSVVRSVVDMRDESSARIWEIGYRSVLRPEEGSGLPWRLGPQDQNNIVAQGGRSRVSNTISDDAATRSHVNAPGIQEPCALSTREGEETRESAGGQEGHRDRAEVPYRRLIEKKEDRMFRREGPIPNPPENTVGTGRATGHRGSPSLSETLSEHRCCVNRRLDQDTLVLAQTPPAGHVARCADNDDTDYRGFHEHSKQPHTDDGEGQHVTSSTEEFDNAVELMTGDRIPRGRRELWPPSAPSSCCGSVVESFLPPRHEDTSQGPGDRLVSSSLVSAAPVAESHTMYPEEHRSMGFVARQRFEQLAAERRREEWSRVQEETRRKLASGGRWVNRTSRAILARSSFSCAGGGGNGNSLVTGGEGRGPSVFERLAHRAPYHEEDPAGDDYSDNEEYGRAAAVGADGQGAREYPFQPTINHRSSLLASRMPHRDEDMHGCPQQRLHREGEEWLSRREKRIQLADEELQEKAAARHVNPESERVLARRSRSRMAWFRSAMMEAFEEVDADRTGWLSLAGVESLLSKCGMLPDQGPDDVRDDVLLAVWAALSEEETSEVGGHGSSDGGLDQGDLKPTFGVPVDDLAVLLAEAARTCEYDRVDARPRSDGHESFPSAFPEELQQNKQIKDVCNELSGIFEVNQLHRASKRQDNRRVQTGETAEEERRACSQGTSAELIPAGRRRDGGDVLLSAPPRVVTRSQVAAMAERFEEQVRERERKIELLRRSEEARTTTDHTFEPSMAATATPEALALRRKVARAAKRQGTGVPSRDRVISESRHPTKTDRRTTEEREVDENCTFQPRLFQPLPMPPPRYPVPSTAHVGGRSGGESTTDSAGEATSNIASATTVDRATASWMAQVNRLKTGRKKRLRRLEEERATANRSEPLPPAVRQLFVDEGIQLCPTKNLSGRSSALANKRDGSATSKGKGCNSARRTSNKVSSPTSWLRLQGRCPGRRRLKDKRREEQARKNAEDDAERLKRKRVLSRACRRSAAVVGLEAALSAREAERECSGLDDPPVVIVELEFVRQKWWALLPFWADTCPKEAVGKLAEQQPRVVMEGVAHELEEFFRDEIDRAGKCMTSVDRDQVAEQGALAGRDVGPGKNNRRDVPKVVLRVDAG